MRSPLPAEYGDSMATSLGPVGFTELGQGRCREQRGPKPEGQMGQVRAVRCVLLRRGAQGSGEDRGEAGPMGLAPEIYHQASSHYSAQRHIQTLDSNAAFKILLFFFFFK